MSQKSQFPEYNPTKGFELPQMPFNEIRLTGRRIKPAEGLENADLVFQASYESGPETMVHILISGHTFMIKARELAKIAEYFGKYQVTL